MTPPTDHPTDEYLEQLAWAHAEHERVREGALRAFRQNELQEHQTRLQRVAEAEANRLQLERENVQLELKVRSLRAEKITLPPRSPTPPPPPRPVPAATPPAPTELNARGPAPAARDLPAPNGVPPANLHRPEPLAQAPPTEPRKLLEPTKAPLQPRETPSATHEPITQPDETNSHRPDDVAAGAPLLLSKTRELAEIHQRLKTLRSQVTQMGKQNMIPKAKIGEMRREIRKSVGQLTEGRGANKTPMANIIRILTAALTEVPSPPCDPSMFLLSVPAPTPDALHNQDALPILFLYLLNVFAKAITQQLVDEAGVRPESADPIGLVAVSVFANKNVCWRGTSFIDILVAKLRVICPVLFGLRGSEKTHEGRARLGWKRDGGSFIPEQAHQTRMTGLGAGFAALTLRNFSKSALKNPLPPAHYWTALAALLNTPGPDISATQCLVLKAMIEHYEARLLTFYGSAARHVLRVALVDFPARATQRSVAATALKVLGDKLAREVGLHLAAPPGF